ncbi:MAG: hypothetical protein HGB32_03615 [Geobacteraceae bacterium]|nr:hypothetical protein [Geobacteraceae bacterium]NTW79220.1 hypothetical protein [Geobacteraceae bacterium]
MAYVEKLETEHILAAMKSFGWAPGKRPPTYVDLRLKCKELFDNGGDGNRLKEMREQAIAMESGVSLTKSEDEPTPHQLPDDLQGELRAFARDFGERLTRFDRTTGAYLARHCAAADAGASARINASRREVSEQLEACDEEISAALSAIQARDSIIEKLEAKLSSALTNTAHAEGRASILSDQVEGLKAKILELELKFGASKKGGVKKTETTKPSGAAQAHVKHKLSQKTSATPSKTIVNSIGGNEAAHQDAAPAEGGE